MAPSSEIAEKILDCFRKDAGVLHLKDSIIAAIDQARKEAVEEYQRSQTAEMKPRE